MSWVHRASFPALVVKASGLAAGKGVIVAANQDEACAAVMDIMKVLECFEICAITYIVYTVIFLYFACH